LKNFFSLKIVIVEVTREETLQEAVRQYQSIFWTLDEAVHELTRTGEMKPFLKEWNKAAIGVSKIHEELGIDQDESTTTLGFPFFFFSIRRKPMRTLKRFVSREDILYLSSLDQRIQYLVHGLFVFVRH
jgi:hypothetical protein